MADNQNFPPPANQGGQTPQHDVPQVQNPPNPQPARQNTSNLIPNPAAAARARTGGASYVHASLDNPSRPILRRGNLQNLPADPRAAGQPDIQNLPIQEQPIENREVLNIEDSPDFPNQQHRDQTEEMAALARQRQLLEDILATERRMMALGRETDQARPIPMMTSRGSLGRNQIHLTPPQHPAVSKTEESEHVRHRGRHPKEEISGTSKRKVWRRSRFLTKRGLQDELLMHRNNLPRGQSVQSHSKAVLGSGGPRSRVKI